MPTATDLVLLLVVITTIAKPYAEDTFALRPSIEPVQLIRCGRPDTSLMFGKATANTETVFSLLVGLTDRPGFRAWTDRIFNAWFHC